MSDDGVGGRVARIAVDIATMLADGGEVITDAVNALANGPSMARPATAA